MRRSAHYRPGIEGLGMRESMLRGIETGRRRCVPRPLPIVAKLARPPIFRRVRSGTEPLLSIPTSRRREDKRGEGRELIGGEAGPRRLLLAGNESFDLEHGSPLE